MFGALALASLLVRWVPFSWWRRSVSVQQTAFHLADAALVADIGLRIQSMSRRLPSVFVCLPQAIAGQWLLRRHKVASQVKFGIRRDGASTLHAWLLVGDMTVSGGEQDDFATFDPDVSHAPKRVHRGS